MGTVFKRTATKSLPVGAELFVRKGQRFAKWQDAKDRTRTAAVIVPTEGKFTGQERLSVETPTYFADFRDGGGILRRVPTGCKDETAARAVLGELEKRAEKVRSGIISNCEDAMTVHQHSALTEHLTEIHRDDGSGGTRRRLHRRNQTTDSTADRRIEPTPAAGH